jgi:hypothetical protein
VRHLKPASVLTRTLLRTFLPSRRLVRVVRIEVDCAEKIEDFPLRAKADVLIQRRAYGFLLGLGLVSSDPSGFFDERVIER